VSSPASRPPGPPTPPGPGARTHGHARPRPPAPRKRLPRDKIAALVIVVIGVIVIGSAVGFGAEQSAEGTVQNFLLDWQQQDYSAAGALTTATSPTVASALKGTFGQLDAAALYLSMDSIVQHGDTAVATFTASVDLAEEGRVWTYQGRFDLTNYHGNWLVDWSPSVIYPGLGQGERLAVVTSFPQRGLILDVAGQPLETPALVYVVGVIPASLANPAATANVFADATGVEATEVAGQITAAPPHQFLKLASLDAGAYARLRNKLLRVPGLIVRQTSETLFKTDATELVGSVGSEVNSALRADGAFYLPGTTIGLNGLEAAYQRQLLGTPSTSIVVLNPAGLVAGQLMRWPGTPGVSERTTIDSAVQRDAIAALGSVPQSGELVAVQASTGDVLAVAQHQGGAALPAGGALDAKLDPGTAFTIVSAAALIESGLAIDTPISCTNSFTVGGQTFTSYGTGMEKPFSTDFADDCGTAFAGLSERLLPGQFAQVAKDFGVQGSWSQQLPVPAFSGSVPIASGEAGLAAETIGSGNVEVSPLAMAMVAAEVDSGSWHPPAVLVPSGSPTASLSSASASSSSSSSALDPATLAALRGLMWGAVHVGAAHAANVSGTPVYGQVGLTKDGSSWLSWFVGYRGDVAFTIIEVGRSPRLSAAALAGVFAAALNSTIYVD
jgi:cell division protein FtsI/penicillin-binding protein 2